MERKKEEAGEDDRLISNVEEAEIESLQSKKKSANKPDLYVIARIISVLKEKGSLNRTALATSTGLAYNRLASYLEWMNDRHFVAINEDGQVSLTQAGIETYDELVRWILRYVGKVKFPRIG